MTVSLQSMSVLELENLAHGVVDASLDNDADASALPPPHVVQRCLALFGAGADARWCFPYLIISASHTNVVGSCGFKGPPEHGEVEIGYGVSPSFQRQGFATAAVDELIRIAFSDGSVTSVLATINPTNVASIRIAEKLGFVKQDCFVDVDGEALIRWRRFC